MNFTNHPILDLRINEDGTEAYFKGQPIVPKEYFYAGRNYKTLRYNFDDRCLPVAKLVCEAWNGMRESMDQVVLHKDFDINNNHYTNLYWGKRGKVLTAKSRRQSSSKIKAEEIPTVIKRIEAGESLTNIGRSYNTSDMSIRRIKRRFMENRVMMLRTAVMHAKTAHERQIAYANYMGYKTVADAITALGTHQFKSAKERLAVQI